MNIATPLGSAEIEKSVEVEMHELARTISPGSQQGEPSEAETSADNLTALLRRVSERSIREIENLVDELQAVTKKLSSDSDRIERDIVEHAALSHQVMQLTNIISESVKKLPAAPSINR